jgi:hypothetical protein
MNEPSLSMIHHLDAVEAAAYRDLFAAAPAALAARLGLSVHKLAGAVLLVAPGIPSSMFNRVIGLGNVQPADEAVLTDIETVYRDAGVKEWWMHLSPGARPAALVDRLAARGYAPPPRSTWAKMLRGIEPPEDVATGLDVRLIRPGEEGALGTTVCAAFGMPAEWAPWFARAAVREHWQGVAAFDGDRLIGGGLLYRDGKDAWLGAGGVLPEARGRHAHRALMLLRLRLAIAAGCTRITTETGEPVGDEPNPSLRNMYACGFSKVCSRLNYAAPAAPPTRSS